MPHTENFKKFTDCDITVEELLEHIGRWNKKYGGEYGILTHLLSSVQVR